jgi:hypothetical protein
MTLRQTIQAAPAKAAELIDKLSATSNQAIKTRESLFAELADELVRYVEIEEQHLLPLLRKHPDTKALAADALKGNKDLRASLARLTALPKDGDAFLAELGELKKGFQQHVRNERKELLPAVLEALSDEGAAGLAASMEGAVAEAEKAKRDEKRDERAQAKREAEEAEQAAETQRAAVRAQKAAERSAREATEKVADTIERGAAAAQDGARQLSRELTERTQQVASEARDAMAAYGESTQRIVEDLRAVQASRVASVEGLSEVGRAGMEWLGQTARGNAEATRQLLQCRSVKQVADLQTEYVTAAMRNWMEAGTKMLETAQLGSKKALRPLDDRLSDAA